MSELMITVSHLDIETMSKMTAELMHTAFTETGLSGLWCNGLNLEIQVSREAISNCWNSFSFRVNKGAWYSVGNVYGAIYEYQRLFLSTYQEVYNAN